MSTRSARKLSASAEAASAELAESLEAPNHPGTKRKLRVLEPTMSHADRFVACAYPWGRSVTSADAVGDLDAAHFGSAVHEAVHASFSGAITKPLCAKLAKKWGGVSRGVTRINADAIRDRAIAIKTALGVWLAGANPWSSNFITPGWRFAYEKSMAMSLLSGTARECAPPTAEDHTYPDRHDGEICGTADLIAWGNFKPSGQHVTSPTLLVLDYKTGFAVGDPRQSGQLLSLALAGMRLRFPTAFTNRAIIGFVHAPEGQEPTIYADTIDYIDLDAYGEKLKAAHLRRGDGSLTPGSWCQYCPAVSICPAKTNALAVLHGGGSGSLALATAEEVGFTRTRLDEYKRLASMVEAEIRQWVVDNGPATMPNGQELKFVERGYSNLSQASIVRALGDLEGRKMIEKLKKLGCIETGTRPELRVE